jgi:hypothetical protein
MMLIDEWTDITEMSTSSSLSIIKKLFLTTLVGELTDIWLEEVFRDWLCCL